MAPQLIFGTVTFGMEMTDFQAPDSVKPLLQALTKLGIDRLDTAARYPPLNPGRSEQLIGESELPAGFIVDTKVYTDTRGDGSGDLTPEAIDKSVNASLERLGNATHWGVSNFSPELLEKVLGVCEQNGWQKPTTYQGTYNMATRGMETKLLPILRTHGMQFVGYQSLAAGFLTGKLVKNEHEGTRADDKHPLGKAIQRIFGDQNLQASMQRFMDAAEAESLTPNDVAVRWVVHHSALDDKDALILGASKISQIQESVGSIRKGPLPAHLVKAADEMWESVKQARGNML
ncbi:hypothetical protein KVR01_012058 [Diaporthe batatas]|uniref:uncharacterized protein n=1 Tax=Diaporthe batatas TaxID=748121 RepID=UPI001D03A686|nr:uncharacterized protein KVR01_012058 [Diaporthe batatas]KAG8158297.1 hypothetical protein KVR01_012058 [Diaporthe batatas]